MRSPSPDADPSPLSLDEIGLAHGTDKSSRKHNYLKLYDRALASRRFEPIRLLEIGVFNGASLRTWRDYFPQGHIVGVDNQPHTLQHAGDRIDVVLGDQDDPEGLRAIARAHGPLDVVIDDGSHIWRHQISTLRALLPMVKAGGVYILEDLHTSYGPYKAEYGAGGGETAASFVLRMADRVLGDRFHALQADPDPFMASVASNVRSIQICGRTAIIQRR